MEISEHSLRALVAAVDDEHRAGLATLPDDIRTLHAEARHVRPAVGGVAIGALAVSFAGLGGSRAFDSGDAGIAAFAAGIELTAVTAYKALMGSGLVRAQALRDTATTFAQHHTEHAAAFGAAAGASATGRLNQALLDAISPGLAASRTEHHAIRLAFDLEQAAAATYLVALGALTSAAVLQLTASILPVEAQHAVVLGQVLGVDSATLLPPFETDSGFVDPAVYPA